MAGRVRTSALQDDSGSMGLTLYGLPRVVRNVTQSYRAMRVSSLIRARSHQVKEEHGEQQAAIVLRTGLVEVHAILFEIRCIASSCTFHQLRAKPLPSPFSCESDPSSAPLISSEYPVTLAG